MSMLKKSNGMIKSGAPIEPLKQKGLIAVWHLLTKSLHKNENWQCKLRNSASCVWRSPILALIKSVSIY